MNKLILATTIFLLLASTIGLASSFTITPTNITNGTSYTTWPTLNITVANSSATGTTTAQRCDYFYNNGTAVTATLTSTNATLNTTWYQTAALGESASRDWSTLAYRCTDSTNVTTGNNTWSNTSGNLYFKYDGTAPVVSAFVGNYLSAGDAPYLNMTAIGTDLNYIDMAWFRVYMTNQSPVTYYASNKTTKDTAAAKFQYLFRNEIAGNTYFSIDTSANDSYGNTGTNTTNITGLVNTLTADQWNLIGTKGNQMLMTICTRSSNLTYVSLYNNTYHNFTTHTCGTSTNNDTVAVDGTGVYVYSTVAGPMYNIYTGALAAANVTINGNLTTTDSPWNIAGVGTAAGRRLSVICTLVPNITYVSYHLSTNNTYFTHRCGWNINNVTAPPGTAVWIKVQDNVTVSIGP